MKQSASQLIKVLATCVFVALITACSSNPATTPPAPTAVLEVATETAVPATATAVPPTATAIPPTPPPTPTRMPGPQDYLLTAEDVPDTVIPSSLRENIDAKHGLIIDSIHFSAANDQNNELGNYIYIYAEPWTEFPEVMNTNASPIDVPTVGQGSQAFESNNDPLDLTLRFFKGRAVVTVKGYGFDLETLVKLAMLVERRIPEALPEPPPIVFADQLDEAAFNRYFKSIEIGSYDEQDEIVPASVFTPGDMLCWGFAANTDIPNHEVGIYDTQAKVTVDKISYFWGMSKEVPYGGCSSLGLPPGQYEIRFSVENVLVKSIPFEIR